MRTTHTQKPPAIRSTPLTGWQIPNEELLTRMVAAESKAAALEQQNRELSAAYEAATVAVTDTAASNSLPTSRPK